MTRIEDAQQLVVQLQCEQCKCRFRLRPKEGRPLRSTVPCPRCHATVAVAWPWMPGSAADPMSEPPPTAVLVKPAAASLPGAVAGGAAPRLHGPKPAQGGQRVGLMATAKPAEAPHDGGATNPANPFEALTRPGVRAPAGRRQPPPALLATPAAEVPARPEGIGGDLIQDFRRRMQQAAALLGEGMQAALDAPAQGGGEEAAHPTLAEPAPAPTPPLGRGPRYAPRSQDVLQQLDARIRSQAAAPAPRSPRWRVVEGPPPVADAAAASPAAPWAEGLDSALRAMPITDRIRATKTSDVAAAAQIDPVLLALGFVVRAPLEAPIGDTLPLPAASPAPSAEPVTRRAPSLDEELPHALASVEVAPAAPADQREGSAAPTESADLDINDLLSLHPLAEESPDEALGLDVTVRRVSPAVPAVPVVPVVPAPSAPPAPGALPAGLRPWLPPVVVPRAEGAPADALPDEDIAARNPWSSTDIPTLGPANDDHFTLGDGDLDDSPDDLAPAAETGRARARGGWLWAASFALVTGAGGMAGWLLNSAQPPAATAPIAATSPAEPAPDQDAEARLPAEPAPAPAASAESPADLGQPAPTDAASALIMDPAQLVPADNATADAEASASPEATPYRDLLRQGRFSEARAALHAARAADPNNATLKGLLQDTFRLDPAFAPAVATLQAGRDVDAIRRLGGGSTLTFKLLRGDAPSAFKPLQTRRQSNYRSEVAAWRLCELIGCSFTIPYNRPVRISHADFEALYDRRDPKQKAYAKGFTDLQWTEADGQTFLYGTQKDWVPRFTQFPIEDTDTWQPWLSVRDRKKTLSKPLSENLRRWLRDDATQRAYRPVLAEVSQINTPDLARQLSDLLVFDFLVGNWDRFSTSRAYWGVNCQLGDGKLISIDNGAAFPMVPAAKVEANLMRAERFNPALIQALRDLDPDTTRAWLFPDASPQDLKRFDQFWHQRGRVLARVDALIAKHGADAVLRFDPPSP